MKKYIFLLSTFIFTISCSSEISTFKSEQTKAENRVAFRQKLIEKIEQSTIINEQNLSTDQLESTFWALELLQYRSPKTDNFVEYLIQNYSNFMDSQHRAILEIVYSLYQNDFIQEIKTLIESENNPKNFAMMANYILQDKTAANKIKSLIAKKFSQQINHPIILALQQNIERIESGRIFQTPPIEDLLNHKIDEDYFYIYSFQRKNRDFRGITIVKNNNGRFVRNDDGSMFFIKHFARSITNLPGYLTNGNTPQGVLSFQGFANSKNVFIGPTTNLQLALPYEFSVKDFFANSNEIPEWNLKLYLSLFPKSWQNYFPIQEAFLAGKAGRTEIIAHGSAIDPEYYKDKNYYPYTPSQGCMTALENWSSKDGSLLESDQLKLYEAVKKSGSQNGFIYVIELNDDSSDVKFEEIRNYLLEKI